MPIEFFISGDADTARDLARRVRTVPAAGFASEVDRPHWAAHQGPASVVFCAPPGGGREEMERAVQHVGAALPGTPVFGMTIRQATGDEDRQATVDRLRLASFKSTVDGGLIEARPAFLELLGFRSEEEALLSTATERYVDPSERERLLRQLDRRGRVQDFEVQLRRKDGRPLWVALTAVLRETAEGRIIEGMVEDISRRKRAHEALRLAEATFRGVVEEAVVGILILRENRFMYLNPRLGEILGYSPDEMINSIEIGHLLPPSQRAVGVRWLRRHTRQARTANRLHLEVRRKDGRPVHVDTHLTHSTIDGEEVFLGTVVDVSDRVRAQAELTRSEERYHGLVENTSDLVFTWDLDGHLTSLNGAAESRLGFRRAEAIGTHMAGLVPAGSESRIAPLIRRAARSGKTVRFETDVLGSDGMALPVEVVAHVLRRRGRPYEVQAIARDITERRRTEARLRHRALHDPLTGAGNRTRLREALDHALRRARTIDGYRFALLFLDLDRFKTVNDTFGHLTGNRLLKHIAKSLRACVRPQDLVVRFGGDEFALLLEDVGSLTTATRVAARVQSTLSQPVELDEQTIVTSGSIGVVMDHGAESTAAAILRNADAALHRAKRTRAGFVVFDEEMSRIEQERQAIGRELRVGLARGELDVFYQAVVDLATCRVMGCEALLRWHHPRLGTLAPDSFLSIAEESGEILEIDRWVLRHGIESVSDLRAEHPSLDLKLNVNLSRLHFLREDAMRPLEEILEDPLFEAGIIRLEVRESALAEHREVFHRLLARFGRLGIQLHVDDYGTGVSAIGDLRRLPVKAVKVDRSITAGLGSDPDCETLIRTIQRLAEDLGLDLVVEGVETQAQLERITTMGIRYAQGHVFGRPMPVEEILRLLEDPAPIEQILAAARS